MTIQLRIRYRIYIRLGRERYFANRLPETPTTWRVSWKKSSEEYPDHWSHSELVKLRYAYLDQHVHYEETFIDGEEDC